MLMSEKPIDSAKATEHAPSKRKTLPPTKWGKPSQLPLGTGIGLYMMCGREVQKPENIIGLFEKIKGCVATDEESASVERVLKAP
jgi:hypothetical protein